MINNNTIDLYDGYSYEDYPELWRKRFLFYDVNGLPGTHSYSKAISKLTVSERLLYRFNKQTLFLGFVVYFYLGLWKRVCLSLLVLSVVGISEYMLRRLFNPDDWILFVFVVFSIFTYSIFISWGINSAYYSKVIYGHERWEWQSNASIRSDHLWSKSLKSKGNELLLIQIIIIVIYLNGIRDLYLFKYIACSLIIYSIIERHYYRLMKKHNDMNERDNYKGPSINKPYIDGKYLISSWDDLFSYFAIVVYQVVMFIGFVTNNYFPGLSLSF